jgi:hypothetical protein
MVWFHKKFQDFSSTISHQLAYIPVPSEQSYSSHLLLQGGYDFYTSVKKNLGWDGPGKFAKNVLTKYLRNLK